MPFDSASAMAISCHTVISTTEMHSAGEPVRIVDLVSTSGSSDGGYPPVIPGRTLLDKRRHVRERLDYLRRFLMWEPRGHYDMYGALIMQPVDVTDYARRDDDDEHTTTTDVPEVKSANILFTDSNHFSMLKYSRNTE
jgi:Proline racemase